MASSTALALLHCALPSVKGDLQIHVPTSPFKLSHPC